MWTQTPFSREPPQSTRPRILSLARVSPHEEHSRSSPWLPWQRAHASIQAGAQDLVHGHSTGSSHRVRRGQSPLGQELQPLRRAQRSSSGDFGSVGRPRAHARQDAPKAVPGTVRCSADSPSLDVRGHEAWRSLGLQSSASMSRRCAQQQQQQHVDDIAPQHARSSPTMVGSSPERRTPAACASLPACQLITADDTRSPSSCHVPASSSCELAGSLACVPPPCSRSPHRTGTSRTITRASNGARKGDLLPPEPRTHAQPALPSALAHCLLACFRALRSLHVLLSGR